MNKEKEQRAIKYLQGFEPSDEPYYLCYSGGKDSDAIRILAQLANVKHEIVHSLTTVDAPETIRYIRSIPNVHFNTPELSMWKLIVKKKYPPTRLARYCCEELKEHGGKGRIKITGVRWDESNNRALNSDFIKILGKPKTVMKIADEYDIDCRLSPKGGVIFKDDNSEARRFVERCYRTTSTMINPIVDWTTKDVWEFLHYYGCSSNPLYQCGENRIGCIGCPLQGFEGMKNDFRKYPKYKEMYIRAFDKMLIARKKSGMPTTYEWDSGKSVMTWWVGDDPAQLNLFDLMGE